MKLPGLYNRWRFNHQNTTSSADVRKENLHNQCITFSVFSDRQKYLWKKMWAPKPLLILAQKKPLLSLKLISTSSCVCQTFYEVLDVPRSATQKEIRKAYIKKTREVSQFWFCNQFKEEWFRSFYLFFLQYRDVLSKISHKF